MTGVQTCALPIFWLESRDNPQPDQGGAVPLVDWNLDADRGYGYHCWDWTRDANAKGVADPEGELFQPPCTWPSQADPPYRSQYRPDVPLKIYWTGPGLQDPGCGNIGGPGIVAALARGAAPEAAKEAADPKKRPT